MLSAQEEALLFLDLNFEIVEIKKKTIRGVNRERVILRLKILGAYNFFDTTLSQHELWSEVYDHLELIKDHSDFCLKILNSGEPDAIDLIIDDWLAQKLGYIPKLF